MNKRIPVIIAIIVLLGGISYLGRNYFKADNENTVVLSEPVNSDTKAEIQASPPSDINANSANENINQAPAATNHTPTTTPRENSVLIKMPFLVQAPGANWDALHEDACEEASLIMIEHYMKKSFSIDQTTGEREIQDLVAYENARSYGGSITLNELNQIAVNYYGLKTGRIEEASPEKIKAEVAAGKPVIIPAAGKILPNPNFRGGGPNYHMLVVKGYDKNGFITNDPGTRKGEGFRYTYKDLINAIHDWNPDNILNGESKYLVFD